MWGSGNIESRDYDLRGFTAVRAGSAFQVEIIQSDTFGVTVRADDNIFGKLVVRTSGHTLHLYKRTFPLTFMHSALEATVRMPALSELELNGAASARVREFRGIERLDLALTGASELKGRFEAESIDLLATGASRVSLSGSAGRAHIEASGASKLNLRELVVATGAVEMSGASSAEVRFTEAIESVDVSGASLLRYLGDPRIGHYESSGASRVARVA